MTMVLAMFVACTKDDGATDQENGAFVFRPDFTDGGEPTRSTFIFDGSILRFGWTQYDRLGIYPTYQLAREEDQENGTQAVTAGPTPKETQEQGLFVCAEGGESTVHIEPEKSMADGFMWADGYNRTAYFPYRIENSPNREPAVYYNAIPFDFSGQVQKGYVDMTAYYNGTGDLSNNDTKWGPTNLTYKETERKACEHLGMYDYMISPEIQYVSSHIRFPLHHIGTVARFFLVTPEEQMRLVSLKLVASEPIFYTRCTADLTSMPYNSGAVDGNDGLKLKSGTAYPGGLQIHPVEESKTAMLELKFPGKGSGEEVLTQKIEEKMYGNYLIAYLMMYPVNTADAKELYVYLDAESLNSDGTPSGEIKHYRTTNLNTPGNTKNMFSGKYYQWTYRTLDDDHPIELTATVIPWQDVVGGNISTGE